MSWNDKSYNDTAATIAWLNPNSDQRDLSYKVRSYMLSKDPSIFTVDDAIMKDPRTKLGFGSSQDGVRSAIRPYVSLPNAVMSGVTSVYPPFDNFKYEMAFELSKIYKPEIDADGFAGPNAVVRDFSALLTCSGVKMAAANAPPTNRAEMLGKAGIASTFASFRHERIFKAMHKIVFGRRVPEAAMSFQVRSSTTMPMHYRGKGSQLQKQSMIHHIGSNLENIFNLLEHDDLTTLYRDHEFYFAMKLVERLQSEGVKDILGGDLTPKPREVADELYALSQGKKGTRSIASKTDITRELFGLKYGVGARVRTAYAVCGQINALIGLFLAGTRSYYLNEGAYTWHHSTPESIYEDIKDFHSIIGMDVKTMDQFLPTFLLDLHADLMSNYYDPRFGKLIRMVNGLPYYAPQLSRGKAPFWAGDPRNPSTFNIDVGLSSGRTDNPDLGKWYMTSTYMCLCDDVIGGVLELGANDEESVMLALKGKHPAFGIKDMSDDAMIGIKTGFESFGPKMRRVISEADAAGKSASPYAVLSLEDGIAFLGNVILKDETGRIARPKPNPVTFIVNRWCPERAINSTSRLYWAHGLRAAEEHYSRAGSIIKEIIDVERALWRKHMIGFPTPEQIIADVILQQPLPVSGLSIPDMEVLLDPSKLYYKFKIEDVSPEVARLFTSSIDGKTVDRYIKPFI